jgi:hypothetical protein
MSKPKEITVDSIAAFAARIEELLLTASAMYAEGYVGNWYRGVAKSKSHTLKPSIYRHSTIKGIGELLVLERRMLEEFNRQNVLHTAPRGVLQENTDLHTLFYMQHYGVPTRLLDWTSNPFIALYFALSSVAPDPKTNAYAEDAAVWVLDPVAWNNTALSHQTHGDAGPIVEKLVSDSYVPAKIFRNQLDPNALGLMNERPATILGVANNPRIFAQKGVFTIFGKDTNPMEQQFDTMKFKPHCLTKLIIPKAKIDDLLKILLQIGYTDSVSYPDLQGLVMEIKRSRGFKS